MYLPVGPPDEDAIRRCLAGDRAAFEPLVERYYKPLFAVAVRMLGDREEARDATQSTFLKAYQSLATYDDQRRFFSWIYRILVNECLNVRRGRRPVQSIGDTDVADTAPAQDPVAAAETHRRVRSALMKLPAQHRDVIVLRHFAEMSYAEVATTLGVDEKTVKSRLYDARQRLCGLLAQERV